MKKFVEAELNVQKFALEDVITTSNGGSVGGGGGSNEMGGDEL